MHTLAHAHTHTHLHTHISSHHKRSQHARAPSSSCGESHLLCGLALTAAGGKGGAGEGGMMTTAWKCRRVEK